MKQKRRPLRLSFFVASRYLRSRKHQKFISFISLASFIGVTIGVMTLVTVLSVMNGFQENIRDKIINVGYHIYVTGYSQKEYMSGYKDIMATLKKEFPDLFITPFFKGQVIVKTSAQRLMAVDLHGVEPDIYEKDLTLPKAMHIDRGEFSLGKGEVLIGTELAKFLGVGPGDIIDVISPEGKKTGNPGLLSFLPSLRKYRISGVFKSGYYEYDLEKIFVSLDDAQALFDRQGEVWGLGVKMDNFFRADGMSWKIKKALDYKVQVFSWMMFNHNFFVALKNEKVIMGLIVFLIILVAAFNIASSLIMMVMEKKKDIGILTALGADKKQIRAVFFFDGMLVGGLGTVLGLFSGLFVAMNLDGIFVFLEKTANFFIRLFYNLFGQLFKMMEPMPFHIIAKDVYYFDKLPVSVRAQDIILIVCGTLILTFLFSLIPSAHAARLNPVEAIRYE